MTTTSKSKATSSGEDKSNEVGRGICGIVMPISTMSEEYPAAHWGRVRKILEVAITQAAFTPRVVWANPEIDVIQSKILQNIYENEIIICDLSNLNPNVMLETGLRLSTKKPTILITDAEKKPPFDIASIEYLSYPKNLEYNKTFDFINDLSTKISTISTHYRSNSYKSFVDNYKFEVINPHTVEVSSEKYISDQLNGIYSLLSNIISNDKKEEANRKLSLEKNIYYADFSFFGTYDELKKIVMGKYFPAIKLIKCKENDEGITTGRLSFRENNFVKFDTLLLSLSSDGMSLSNITRN